MEDENDELIDRLNRLKPVVPDFEESKFEEFDEPEFDEFEVPNEFEELNKDANELLINRKRMKKKEFTKKTGYIFNSNEEKINK